MPSKTQSLRKHGLDLFVCYENFVDGIPSVFQGCVLALDVGGQENLWVPGKPLAGLEKRYQAWGSRRITNIDEGTFLLGDGRA